MRSLQIRVALAFLAVVVGFVGAIVYVPVALWPVAERVESIQARRAEAVHVLGELRGSARELRSAALLAFESQWDRSLAWDEQERAVQSARDRMKTIAVQYLRQPRPRPPDVERAWQQLADVDFPALDAAVDDAVTAARRPGGDPAALQRLLAAGASVDHGLQHLGDVNAAAAQADVERIHVRIHRLAFGYVVLAALGAAGALLLLRQTLGLLRGYATGAERRVAELEAFAGQVSHDLRSPLQTIQLAVTSIERKAKDESLRRMATRASASVRRLDGMIHDLLQFARSGAAAEQGAKRLVESHDGTIAVESEQGRGSTFSVAFRRAESPGDARGEERAVRDDARSVESSGSGDAEARPPVH